MLHSFDLPLSNYSTAARNLSRALYPNRIRQGRPSDLLEALTHTHTLALALALTHHPLPITHHPHPHPSPITLTLTLTLTPTAHPHPHPHPLSAVSPSPSPVRPSPFFNSFHDGNSKLTLPPFVDSVRKGQTPPCDLWYIDGLHTHSHNMHYGPYDDMRQALQTSHNGTILIADDCTRKWAAVTNGWQRLTAGTRSAVTRISLWDVLPERSSYNKTGWCAGRVLMQ